MIERRLLQPRTFPILCSLILSLAVSRCAAQGPPYAAVTAFDSYVRAIEYRLAARHRSPQNFLAIAAPIQQCELQLRRGKLIVEQLTPTPGLALPGALLHHWRATAFVPGASAAGFARIMQDFGDYPHYFAPQVLRANILARQGDHFQVSMRIRQHHIITVVLDTTYDVTFGRFDNLHRYSISRSTHIAEADDLATTSEQVLNSREHLNLLWRQYTYWTWEQHDGGLYIQVESISLTPSIPWGLGWAVGPFVKSIPRESLEFTLRSVLSALQQQERTQK